MRRLLLLRHGWQIASSRHRGGIKHPAILLRHIAPHHGHHHPVGQVSHGLRRLLLLVKMLLRVHVLLLAHGHALVQVALLLVHRLLVLHVHLMLLMLLMLLMGVEVLVLRLHVHMLMLLLLLIHVKLVRSRWLEMPHRWWPAVQRHLRRHGRLTSGLRRRRRVSDRHRRSPFLRLRSSSLC